MSKAFSVAALGALALAASAASSGAGPAGPGREAVKPQSSPPASHPAPPPANTAPCVLQYQRADNMWADTGRPDGPLGVETITLQPGQRKVFVTDWKYEKVRNDGNNFYGSHLRVATNAGTRPVAFVLAGFSKETLDRAVGNGILRVAYAVMGANYGDRNAWELMPGKRLLLRADLQEVGC
jgi:hypothetical protein